MASSEPCVSIAAFGGPAVPAVKSSTASVVGFACDGFGRAAAVARFRVEHQQRGAPIGARRRPSPAVRVFGGRDEERGLDLRELPRQLLGGRKRIERHRNCTHRQRRKVCSDEGRFVVGNDRHPIADAHVLTEQRVRPCDPGAELAVASPVRRRPRAPVDPASHAAAASSASTRFIGCGGYARRSGARGAPAVQSLMTNWAIAARRITRIRATRVMLVPHLIVVLGPGTSVSVLPARSFNCAAADWRS